jgi:hypothetical protein
MHCSKSRSLYNPILREQMTGLYTSPIPAQGANSGHAQVAKALLLYDIESEGIDLKQPPLILSWATTIASTVIPVTVTSEHEALAERVIAIRLSLPLPTPVPVPVATPVLQLLYTPTPKIEEVEDHPYRT